MYVGLWIQFIFIIIFVCVNYPTTLQDYLTCGQIFPVRMHAIVVYCVQNTKREKKYLCV